MATFIQDLERALAYGSFISRERSRSWRTNSRPLLEWQRQSFSSLLSGGEASEINAAWLALHAQEATREAAELLHQELQAVVEFQGPLVDLPFNPYEWDEPEEPDSPRRTRPLKKSLQLLKTLLESLKEILGDLLGIKGKAILQVAIEAAEAFA